MGNTKPKFTRAGDIINTNKFQKQLENTAKRLENEVIYMPDKEQTIKDCIKYHYGARYVDKDFATFKPRDNQQPALDWFKTNNFLDHNIFMYSQKNLTGKTTFLAMITKEIYRRYGARSLKIWTDAELQAECYQRSLNYERNNLQTEYKDYKFFIFKDFAKFTTTKDFFMPALFEFIDWIYSNSPPIRIFMASNYTPEEIARFESKNWLDIAARISDMCQIIEL